MHIATVTIIQIQALKPTIQNNLLQMLNTITKPKEIRQENDWIKNIIVLGMAASLY